MSADRGRAEMFEWISIVVILMLALLLVIVVNANQAQAHDTWADGSPIPDWIKSSCCGKADAHHLRPEQVHRISDDYYQVDGYLEPIPVSHALPSQDGDYWIFYRGEGKDESGVYCFFVPMAF